VYYRYIRTRTYNGDINEDALDQAVYQPNAAERAALTAGGFSSFPVSGESAANTPFPKWRCIANALGREPAEKCNALINQTFGLQRNYGASGQLTWYSAPGAPQRNQLTGGFAYDRSTSDFSQSSELGYLNPDRSVTGVGAFADGVTGGVVDDEPFDTRANLRGGTKTASVYATDTLSFGRRWSITGAGRYSHVTIDNRDRITPSGPGSLTGRHTFDRFNPSIGLTFNPVSLVNAYASYSEASRAPTSVELGCADPTIPCRLPNALQGDPPLKQVIARTLELGLRGGLETAFSWNASWFRADNRDDILFVSSPQTGFGYFKNFGKTRRQGVQLDVSTRLRVLNLGGGYTWLDGTFQSPEEVTGSGNSTNLAALRGESGQESVIDIRPGNRLPLTPRHLLKAYADLSLTRKLTVDLSLFAASRSFARGNENNVHQADGTYYLGPGTSPGYAVVNAGARYQWSPKIEVFVQLNNMLNRTYYSGAQLGPVGITPTGTFIARPLPAVGGQFPIQQSTFFAPGAPFGAFAGIRLRF
jgi:outer membrane receptor protein involved in Fe transport